MEVLTYPNPTNGKLKIKLDNFNSPDITVRVLNMAGQIVFNEDYRTNGEIEIDLTGNKTGLYMLDITVDERSIVKKINIEER